MTGKFVEHAVNVFKTLGWKPAPPDTLSKPGLIVWGNLDSHGFGTHCVIDWQMSLFKIQVRIRNESEIMELKLVSHFKDEVEAETLFEKYMDIAGGTVKDFVVGLR